MRCFVAPLPFRTHFPASAATRRRGTCTIVSSPHLRPVNSQITVSWRAELGWVFLKRLDVEHNLEDHRKAHAQGQRQAKATRESSTQMYPKFGVLSYAATLLSPAGCVTENQPSRPAPNPCFLPSPSPSPWLLVELAGRWPRPTMPSLLTWIHTVTKPSRERGAGGGGLAAGGCGAGPCEEDRLGLPCAGHGRWQPVPAGSKRLHNGHTARRCWPHRPRCCASRRRYVRKGRNASWAEGEGRKGVRNSTGDTEVGGGGQVF